jgi:uncharacterized protein (DUF1330 family)
MRLGLTSLLRPLFQEPAATGSLTQLFHDQRRLEFRLGEEQMNISHTYSKDFSFDASTARCHCRFRQALQHPFLTESQFMAAYLVVHLDVKDWDKFREYARHAPRTIAKFDGRFIARGGEMITLEGPQETMRIVLIEFPSMEQAKAYYQSPEYTETKKLREGAADARFVAIDGFDANAWPALLAESQALAMTR